MLHFDLNQVSAVRPATEEERTSAGKRANCWIIATPKRTYIMSAQNHKFMDRWIKSTSDAVSSLDPNNDYDVENSDLDAVERLVNGISNSDASKPRLGPGGNGILKEGTLTQKSVSRVSFRTKWRKRYVVLTSDSLAYYVRQNGRFNGNTITLMPPSSA